MEEEQFTDVTEIKLIIDNLEFLEQQFPVAIRRWKKQIKNCDWATRHLSRGILKALCDKPGILHERIFAPLYRFLRTYMAIREKRIAYTGAKLDDLLRKGLNAVQRYLVVSDFFADNPRYFIPSESMTDLQKWKETNTKQQQYKDFIKTLNSRLIGCGDNNKFQFLKLLDTVKTFPKGSDAQKIFKENKDYIRRMCIDIRIHKLKL